MMTNKKDILEALEYLKGALQECQTPLDELNGRFYEVLEETPLGRTEEEEDAYEELKEFFSTFPTESCLERMIDNVNELIELQEEDS